MLIGSSTSDDINSIDYIVGAVTDSGATIQVEEKVEAPGWQPAPAAPDFEEPVPTPPDGTDLNSVDFVFGVELDNCKPTDPTDCRAEPSAEPTAPAPAPAVTVTLRDIASFVPAKPGNTMEPGGWAVEDLPANFVAEASAQVVSGTLLGRLADVRFTPVAFRWRHSDGVVVESGTPGATWVALGQAEFTPTGTSHVYAESGEYTVTLEAVLRAEYRFGGSGWRMIAGTLAVAGDPQPVLVGEFDTVLTNGDCNANPSGPGC
ncbi:hypothetical protein ACFSEO_09180 [Agromyces cerinus subsp. nitratus]